MRSVRIEETIRLLREMAKQGILEIIISARSTFYRRTGYTNAQVLDIDYTNVQRDIEDLLDLQKIVGVNLFVTLPIFRNYNYLWEYIDQIK